MTTQYVIDIMTIQYVIGIILVFIIIVSMVLIYDSFTIIQPEEFGKKVRLGKPVGNKLNSGLHLKLPYIEKIVRIPKGLMNIEFTADSITTKKGNVAGYGEVSPIDISLDCTLYFAFDEERLDDILQYSPGYDANSLKDYLISYVFEVVRALGGRAPWRLINEERYDGARWIGARLVGGIYKEIKTKDDDNNYDFHVLYCLIRPGDKKEQEAAKNDAITKGVPEENIRYMDKHNPFTKIGFKEVSLVIEDVNTVEEIGQVVSAAEKANLEKIAAIIKAEADAKTKVLNGEADAQVKVAIGKADAEAREKMLAVIQKYPQLEAISALKELGKGQSNFVFPIPKEFMELIGDIMNPKK